jgi:hypothetical protein
LSHQNLTNWKSERRKKVEHVIERVVEAKKYEEEAFDRDAASRRRKTFSEMMQERYDKEDSTTDTKTNKFLASIGVKP